MISTLLRFAAEGVHHCVAHPLLFVTRGAAWVVRLHDATARAAWPGPREASR